MLCMMLAARLSPGAGMSTVSLAWNRTVPNTRRSGWAKLPAEYWLAGVGSGKPQSQPAPARTAREAKRCTTPIVSSIEAAMKAEHQQAVVGAAAGLDRAMVSHTSPSCIGMRAPVSACATGAMLSITAPGTIPASRHSSAKVSMAAMDQGSASRACARCVAAGAAKEDDAEGPDEAGSGQRGGQGEQRAVDRDHQFQAPLRQFRVQQDGLEGQPLGGETVQRRQGGDRDATCQERDGGARHAVDQAAHRLHVALAGGVQHRAGAEEQQAFEHRVVERVEQRGGQGEGGARVEAGGAERQRQAEADEHDADIFDGRVGEQALQVALHQRVQDAEDGGDRRPSASTIVPAHHVGAQQIEDDADEAVDRDFGHHAAHQRRDVAGRGGVRQRQPDVQRHKPGFRSGSDQREDEAPLPRSRRPAGSRAWRRRRSRLWAGQQAESEQQGQAAEGRHDEVDEAGARAAMAGVALMRHHQRPGGQRHQFPGEQKHEGVVGDGDERHAGEEGGIERQDASGVRFVAAIAQREQAGAGAAEADQGQEEAGQGVEAEMGADPGEAERKDKALDGGGEGDKADAQKPAQIIRLRP